MNGKYMSIVLAFLSGVILTLFLLFLSGYGQARYAPFGGKGSDIIDVRTGEVFSQAGTVWKMTCQAANKKPNN